MGLWDKIKKEGQRTIDNVVPGRKDVGGGMVATINRAAVRQAEMIAEEERQFQAEQDENLVAAAKRQRRQYGRAATLLTGGQGVMGEPTTVRRSLLGA